MTDMNNQDLVSAILQEHLAPNLADEFACRILEAVGRRGGAVEITAPPGAVAPFLDFAQAAVLLHQYSEWLDGEGLMRADETPGPETKTHDDLVREFIASRDPEARPALVKR